jgi:hypothetical protein
MSPTYLQSPRSKSQPNKPRTRAESRRAAHEQLNVVARSEHLQRQRTHILLNTWFGWLVLMPVCFISLAAFLQIFIPAALDGRLFGSADLRWFTVGALTWSSIYMFLGQKMMICYVFAHEWTHVLVARLFGAKIYDVRVSAKGGYVETNKSNVAISLAPYVLPFYTLLFMGLCVIVNSFVDLTALEQISLGSWQIPFNYARVYYACAGLTWGFHLCYTLATLKTEQTDLLRNGESFSLFLIVTLNLYLLAFLLVLSSNVGAGSAWVTLQQTFASAAHGLSIAWQWLMQQLQGVVTEVSQKHAAWQVKE